MIESLPTRNQIWARLRELGLSAALPGPGIPPPDDSKLSAAMERAVGVVLARLGNPAGGGDPTSEVRARLKEARRECSSSPLRAIRTSRLCLEAAKGLAGPLASRASETLLAECWAVVAYTLRAAGRFRAAATALDRADQALSRGVPDPLVEATILAYRGALLSDRSDFREALITTRKAKRIARQVGQDELTIPLVLQEASLLGYLGRSEEALTLLDRTLENLSPARSSRLAFAAAVNRASLLLDLDRSAEAVAALSRVRQAHRDLLPLDELRLRWLEARSLLASGEVDLAWQALSAVRDEFTRQAMPQEVALATLEMALAAWLASRWEDARALAVEALPLFRTLGCAPETLACLGLVKDSVDAEFRVVEALTRALRTQRSSRIGSPKRG